ncbi:MAG TPA: hypothetical protein VIX89_10075 [Bryobacteraceae bacterium]
MDSNKFRTRTATLAFLMAMTLMAAPAQDALSGEWEASFDAHGDSVPVTLNLKRDGNKVTGTFESAHLGRGALSNGSFAANRLSLTMEGPHGTVEFTGQLTAGKLAGEFHMGEEMQGKWEAKKKIE